MERSYICANCSVPFTSKKGHVGRIPRFCSRKCFSDFPKSAETLRRQSESHIGKPSWNKGVAQWKDKQPPRLGVYGHTGGVVTDETRRKVSEAQRGKPKHSLRGEGHWNWQGGRASRHDKERKSLEYKQWRRRVFERNNYTCQECGQRGGRLHADHIEPFAFHPELRHELSNGRTLCRECHIKTDTYGHKAVIYARNRLSQTLDFEATGEQSAPDR